MAPKTLVTNLAFELRLFTVLLNVCVQIVNLKIKKLDSNCYSYFLLLLCKSSIWFTEKHIFKIIIYFLIHQNVLQIMSFHLRYWYMMVSYTVFPHIVAAETILFWIYKILKLQIVSASYVMKTWIVSAPSEETIQGRKLYEEIR